LTYDFHEIAPFIEEFRKGAEFIMGSRFRGSIEKGAMPKLHRYFGTPLTNWILNRIYRSDLSDIAIFGPCSFAPASSRSQIRLRYHKFGLNLFAAARKDDVDQPN
jgi:hypothetical protein